MMMNGGWKRLYEGFGKEEGRPGMMTRNETRMLRATKRVCWICCLVCSCFCIFPYSSTLEYFVFGVLFGWVDL